MKRCVGLLKRVKVTARDILAKFKNQLDIIANGLLDRETLSRAEIDELIEDAAHVAKKTKAKKPAAKKPSTSFGAVPVTP